MSVPSASPPSASAEALDHVGIAANDLAALAAQWEALGFCLTPLARHSGKRTPDGPVVPFGTGNHCIMLREGYLELIAIVDPGAFSNTLDRFLARYTGIHILALSIADEEANLARLRRAGIDIPGVAYLERPVDDADPAGPKARFARLPLPDPAEGRIQLIRHLTPEAIWQDRFMVHPNHAVALAEIVLAVEHPAEAAARFSLLAGRPVVPDLEGGFQLDLPRGKVRILPPEAVAQVFPAIPIPCLPFIAGITVRTDDATHAASALLTKHGVPHRNVPNGRLIDPTATGGVALLLT